MKYIFRSIIFIFLLIWVIIQPFLLILINLLIFLWNFKITEDIIPIDEVFSISLEPNYFENRYHKKKYIYCNPFDYLLNKKTYYKRSYLNESDWILDLERNAIYNEKN